MMTNKFSTKGTVNTSMEIRDDAEEYITFSHMSQCIDLAGSANIEDNGEMDITLTGTISNDAHAEWEHKIEDISETQYVGMDISVTKTKIEMSTIVDKTKASLKMTCDEDTMKTLTSSKMLKLITEDGKEVLIEMKIEQD